MPSGILDNYFSSMINWLVDYAENRADALLLEADGDWATAKTVAGIAVDPFAIPELRLPFLRTDINVAYQETLIEGNGSLGDCSALTLQGDYLAAMERCYRLRHASKLRRQTWAAARFLGHADPKGIFERVQDHVTEILTDANTGYLPPFVSAQDYLALAQTQNQAMGREV